MFEKEAEEAGNEKIKENHQFARCARKSYKDGFKDGAEFGYNKAFVEADKNLKAIVTDFNKANEWHYPLKGEYPKEGENVLCYCKCRTEIKFCCVGHIVAGGDNKIRWWSSDRSEKLKVYAWREIVPPKEIEEK